MADTTVAYGLARSKSLRHDVIASLSQPEAEDTEVKLYEQREAAGGQSRYCVTMAKCVVRNCKDNSRNHPRNPQIILHGFPKNVDGIISWLRQVPQDFEDLEGLANRIKIKYNYYRMCSRHFTLDSYHVRGGRNLLKPDAIPTIFKKIGRHAHNPTRPTVQQSANQSSGIQAENKQAVCPPPGETSVPQPCEESLMSTPFTVSIVAKCRDASTSTQNVSTPHVTNKKTMNKDKSISERILTHTLEIISLVTGEHLADTQIMTEINKDVMVTERILNYNLEIIYLLTGEKYPIVKKNPPHSHHLTGECDTVGHKEMMDENQQTDKSLGSQEDRNSGIHDEDIHTESIKEEIEDVVDEKDFELLEIHSDPGAGPSNVNLSILSSLEEEEDHQQVKEEDILIHMSEDLQDEDLYNVSVKEEEGDLKEEENDFLPVEIHSDTRTGPTVSKIEQEELNIMDSQQVKEEDIPVNISEGLHDESLNIVSINEEGEYETEEKNNQQMDIHPEPCVDGSMNTNSPGQHQGSEQNMNIFIIGNISEYGENSLSFYSQPLTQQRTIQKQFACSQCGKSFSQRSHLITHERIHTDSKPFSCSECGKCFNQRSNLVSHEKTHMESKPFACSECGECFKHRKSLIRHEGNHTGFKPFSCSQCGKCFRLKVDLARHEKSHKGYACSECGKCFSNQSYLIVHKRAHTGEKPFPCSVCGKCFSRKAHLIKHHRTHTGEKPFACSECGKCFTCKSHLVSHERTHTGEKPYACSECGKCYSQKAHLIKHHRTHTGGKPFVCSE
ncbi:uncharacterized protein O3C94_015647 [Discoglossus pictus]